MVVPLEGAAQLLVLEGPGARKQRRGFASCMRTSNCSRSAGDRWGIHQICTGLGRCSKFARGENMVEAEIVDEPIGLPLPEACF